MRSASDHPGRNLWWLILVAVLSNAAGLLMGTVILDDGSGGSPIAWGFLAIWGASFLVAATTRRLSIAEALSGIVICCAIISAFGLSAIRLYRGHNSDKLPTTDFVVAHSASFALTVFIPCIVINWIVHWFKGQSAAEPNQQ